MRRRHSQEYATDFRWIQVPAAHAFIGYRRYRKSRLGHRKTPNDLQGERAQKHTAHPELGHKNKSVNILVIL